jgi:hypothetical protein
VTLRFLVRRFFRGNLSCEKSAIFAERLLEVTAYARKTDRLQGALALIGFALGGRAGARLAQELGLMASPATLLRRGRHAAFADAGEVRVLGVDDWARHKGVAYSTILVDLERCRPSARSRSIEASAVALPRRGDPGGLRGTKDTRIEEGAQGATEAPSESGAQDLRGDEAARTQAG